MKRTTILNWKMATLAILLATQAAFYLGCEDDERDDDNGPSDTDTMPSMQAFIRVTHASATAPEVDVFAGADLVIEGLAFGESSDYLVVPPGNYTFDVVPAGGALEDSVLTIPDIELEEDTFYTAYAFNDLMNLEAGAIVDDYIGVGPSDIRIRPIHAATDVGQVDIWDVTDGESPVLLYENVAFGNVGDYLDVPAGAYDLGFDVDDDGIPDLILPVPDLPSGTVANVYALNDGDGVHLLAQLDADTTVRIDIGMTMVRVLHGSPDAPSVDIFAGENRVIEGLAFGESSDYLEVSAGVYDFSVVPAGGALADAVLQLPGTFLGPDTFNTAFAFNELASIEGSAIIDNYEGVAAGNIRIRAIHAAAGVATVDIWDVTDPAVPMPLYEDVPFGAVGNYLDVPAGPYDLGFDVDDDAVPDLIFPVPALADGAVANVFALNDEGGVHLLAQLDADTTVRIDAGTSMLRVLHLTPDAPAVDVFVDDDTDPSIIGLAYPENTDYLEFSSAGYEFFVSATGGTPAEAVLSIEDLILSPNTDYTAVAYGSLATIAPLALVDDLSATGAGNFRVRAIHAADGVGQVDIWNLTTGATPAILYEDVDFGAVGEYLELPSADYTLGFDVNDDAVPDLTFDIPALAEGTVANVFAVNDDGVKLIAQLDDGSIVSILPNP